MALLDSLFGQTPSYYGGLLGEDELSRLRQQAQEQGTLNTAMALLQAGAPSRTPGGGALAIAQGLQQGQQAYRQALNQGLQEKMTGLQIGEQIRKTQEAQRMREIFPQVFQVTQTPEQLTMYGQPTQGVIRDDEGNLMPGGGVTPARQNVSIDTNRLAALISQSSNPLESLAAVSKLIPDLRKAGLTGGMTQGENPFSVYANDPTVPTALRQVAANYQQSYARGLIDQETADKRLADLGARVQSAQQFQQSQAGLEEQRRASNLLAQGQQAISGMMAQEKVEAAKEKRETAATTKSEAKSQLTDIVGSLKKNYETLKEQGGIVSTSESGIGNIVARLSSSGLGQAIGGAVGARTQEERQKIEQTRPLLLNLIKNATGMSAQQMNSNAEMQLYLNAATNPQLSYEANLEALKNLDSLYGLGVVAKDIEKELKNPAKPSGPSKSSWK
jgi:hypothetical protein